MEIDFSCLSVKMAFIILLKYLLATPHLTHTHTHTHLGRPEQYSNMADVPY